jgi:hypothetical protein
MNKHQKAYLEGQKSYARLVKKLGGAYPTFDGSRWTKKEKALAKKWDDWFNDVKPRKKKAKKKARKK